MTGESNKGRTVRRPDDPLSYDMTDFDAGIDKMIDDVRTGRTKDAVDAELARVRQRYIGTTGEQFTRQPAAQLPDDEPEAPTP